MLGVVPAVLLLCAASLLAAAPAGRGSFPATGEWSPGTALSPAANVTAGAEDPARKMRHFLESKAARCMTFMPNLSEALIGF